MTPPSGLTPKPLSCLPNAWIRLSVGVAAGRGSPSAFALDDGRVGAMRPADEQPAPSVESASAASNALAMTGHGFERYAILTTVPRRGGRTYRRIGLRCPGDIFREPARIEVRLEQMAAVRTQESHEIQPRLCGRLAGSSEGIRRTVQHTGNIDQRVEPTGIPGSEQHDVIGLRTSVDKRHAVRGEARNIGPHDDAPFPQVRNETDIDDRRPLRCKRHPIGVPDPVSLRIAERQSNDDTPDPVGN